MDLWKVELFMEILKIHALLTTPKIRPSNRKIRLHNIHTSYIKLKILKIDMIITFNLEYRGIL